MYARLQAFSTEASELLLRSKTIKCTANFTEPKKYIHHALLSISLYLPIAVKINIKTLCMN